VSYLKMCGITKVYPNGVVANRSVNLDVEKGEIHALLGENGAGKSTLMKILYGIERADAGKIFLEGEEAHIASPLDAIRLKIGMVHQEFMLIPSLSVAENCVLGIEPRRGLSIDKSKAIELTERFGEEFGLPVPPSEIVAELPVGMRQRVEILKVLLRGAELLILDEPTAVLTPLETEELFAALKTLVARGKTIIFVTHKLKEVKQLADRFTVLRDGRNVGSGLVSEVSEAELVRMMVGRAVEVDSNKKSSMKPGAEVLAVKNVFYVRDGRNVLHNVSFKVRSGEIVAIAGVEGNGQAELVDILVGLRKATRGKIFLNGKECTNAPPKEIRSQGVACIPADRIGRGVAMGASIEENLIAGRYFKREFSRWWGLDKKAIREYAKNLMHVFRIRAITPSTQVGSLSGGNIQRVVVARELSASPQLLIADQPTRGLDVAAAEFVRRRLIDERDRGAAILLVSTDLEEIMRLADRIIVMYNGSIVAHFADIESATPEVLGQYMLGVERQSEREVEGA